MKNRNLLKTAVMIIILTCLVGCGFVGYGPVNFFEDGEKTNSHLSGNLTTETYHSPSHSYKGSLAMGGNNEKIVFLTNITVPNARTGQLKFWHKYDIADPNIRGVITVDYSNTTKEIKSYTGHSDWVQETIDLSPYLTCSGDFIAHSFCFEIDGLSSVSGIINTWYVDDISIDVSN